MSQPIIADSLHAAGCASLPWIAAPTRAGWWWFWFPGAGKYRWPVGIVNRDGVLKVYGTQSEMEVPRWASVYPGGRWAGPVEPPEPPDEKPTHKLSREACTLLKWCNVALDKVLKAHAEMRPLNAEELSLVACVECFSRP